ncbi:MAG: tRNA (N6-threonylcarbamoyladenosine(37)-N6)-methyltransferase TrmO [Gammaproteobacteria bacterium]|nr:MAG: tRNA (N6-threonylcarbamoyladenosine(37)-N6)-methyltransferase TrmO [Gammaproteobacteria bacterium]
MTDLETIATVQSPFKERFGIPRQPGLVSAHGSLLMQPGFDDPVMFDGLDEFSHIWVTFVFHASADQGWKAKVRPPRLGGKRQVGVFASRSPHRPNFLGLSLLKLEGVQTTKPVHLKVSGLDLLDGTPIIDIKPYVAYSDAVPDARSGFAAQIPAPTQTVVFSDNVRSVLNTRPNAEADEQLIRQVLSLDPRPAYKKRRITERLFGVLLDDFEMKWRVDGDVTEVVELNLKEKT